MLKKLLCGFLLISAPLYSTFVQAGSDTIDTIQVCGDGAGWPPYTFFKREDGKKTKEIAGYDVDVLNYIFSKQGIKVTFAMPSWNRCLKLTEAGNPYQIALSASYSKERDTKYLMTRDYYITKPYYFYSRKKYPQGINITGKEDFLQYKVCGLFAYNYAGFNVPFGKIDQGSENFDSVVKKTHAGRCDLFVSRYEIIAGFASIDINYLEGGLGYSPIPGATQDKFYMLISRNYKHANRLKKIIDEGITDMEKSGKLGKILEKYISALK